MNEYERRVLMEDGYNHLLRFYRMANEVGDQETRLEQRHEVCALAKDWIKAFEIDEVFAIYLKAYNNVKEYYSTADNKKFHLWTRLEEKYKAEIELEFLDNVLSRQAIRLLREAIGDNKIGTKKLPEISCKNKTPEAVAQRKARKAWVQYYVDRNREAMEDYLSCYVDDNVKERG